MLYGKLLAERDNDALDALESCLSASHIDIQQPYKLRLEPFKTDILAMLEWFNKEETLYEHTKLMQLVVSMFDGEYFTGFQINANAALIERMRKRVKGKLMYTRSILQDKDAAPACLSPLTHRQVCKCKNAAKNTLANHE